MMIEMFYFLKVENIWIYRYNRHNYILLFNNQYVINVETNIILFYSKSNELQFLQWIV